MVINVCMEITYVIKQMYFVVFIINFFLVLFADVKSSNVVSDPSAMSANGEISLCNPFPCINIFLSY